MQAIFHSPLRSLSQSLFPSPFRLIDSAKVMRVVNLSLICSCSAGGDDPDIIAPKREEKLVR